MQLPLARQGRLDLGSGRPLLLGILNLTPDSFSDGGHFFDLDSAVAHAERLLAEGADLLDLGAESTRPGGGVYGAGLEELTPAEELGRLLPVLRAVRARWPEAVLSVDTRKGKVARAALAEGADLINDVGGLADPALVEAVAEAGCAVVVMHSRGELRTMQQGIHFGDVVAEVRQELAARVAIGLGAGLAPAQIVVDPGIGFGKKLEHNLALLRGVPALRELGYPVLIGASRKSFIAALSPAGPQERLPGSLAAAGQAAAGGAAFLRVHDVAATRQYLDVFRALAAL